MNFRAFLFSVSAENNDEKQTMRGIIRRTFPLIQKAAKRFSNILCKEIHVID